MAEHAAGTFAVASWDEQSYAELGGAMKLSKASMAFDFSGDFEGRGTSETLMFYREDGTASYTGLQQMTGRIGDRSGSFVLLADGAYDGTEASTRWQVLAGSGTGDLAGLSGSGTAVAGHQPPGTFALDYELG